jgi:DNA repair protein RadC
MTNPLYQIAEIDLVYRRQIKASERPHIATSRDAYKLFRENWDDCKINLVEQFKILLLNRNNKVLGLADISLGGMGGTVVDPKIVFAIALKSCASGIILAHNHPSETLQPSQPDIQVTRNLALGGQYLDIRILDHLIITNDGYYSFADDARMPSLSYN